MAETFCEYLYRTLGTSKWVVASRMTQRLRDKGYTVAISSGRYRQLEIAWEIQEQGAATEALRKAAPALAAPALLAAAKLAMLHAKQGAALPMHAKDHCALIVEALEAAIAQAEGKE